MRRYAWLVFVGLLAGVFPLQAAGFFPLQSASAGHSDPDPGDDDDPDDDGIAVPDVEQKVFGLVNQARAKKGIGKMDHNGVIRREARKHSHDMALDDDVDHDNFDERVQIIARDDEGVDPNRLCELVTRIRGTPTTAPGRIFERFRRASGGRTCLFNGDFTTQSVGVGVVFNEGHLYATLIAANDRT